MANHGLRAPRGKHPGAFGNIHKGAFHRWLGKAEGAPITEADIAKGRAAGGHPAKMANFAANAKRGFK